MLIEHVFNRKITVKLTVNVRQRVYYKKKLVNMLGVTVTVAKKSMQFLLWRG